MHTQCVSMNPSRLELTEQDKKEFDILMKEMQALFQNDCVGLITCDHFLK